MTILYILFLCLLVVKYPLDWLLAAVSSTVVLPLIWLFPEYVILSIVIVVSSIVTVDNLPLIPLPGIGSLHITDVLLFILLGRVIFRHLFQRDIRGSATPLATPLILFFSMVIFSACTSIFGSGVDANTVIRDVRYLSYYLLFFVISSLFTNVKQVHILTKNLMAIGTFVALAMITQAVIGESFLLIPGRVEAAGTFESDYGVLRILPPGETLVYVLFISILCRVVLMPKRSLLNLFLIAVLGAGVALTYNRVYWVSIIVALTALYSISRKNEKKRVISVVFMVTAVSLMTLTAFSFMGGRYAESAVSITERFTSIFAGKKLSGSSSLVDRTIENDYALQTIYRNPFLGSGLHTVYRPNIYGSLDTLQYYVHNAYLWLVKDIGILGLGFFLWFFGGSIARGITNFNRIEDETLRITLAGFTLSSLGMIPMSLINPVYMQWYSIICIAISAGTNEVIIKHNENRGI